VFTASFLTRVERRRKRSIHFYIEINELSRAGEIAEELRDMFKRDCYLEIVPSKSGTAGALGLLLTISYNKDIREQMKKINAVEGVAFTIVES